MSAADKKIMSSAADEKNLALATSSKKTPAIMDHEKKMLVLQSSDGKEFEVEKSIAIQSTEIKNIIESDDSTTIIPLPEVHSKALTRVLEYLEGYAAAANSEADLNDFNRKFKRSIKNAKVADKSSLLLAAYHLNIDPLVDVVCRHMADMIRGMSTPEEVRQKFNIKNDFTEEEEAALREQHGWAWN